MFADRHWVTLKGGRAAVEFSEGVIYFAMLVRNVGNGMAFIESWMPIAGQKTSTDAWGPIDDFRPQTRSLWIAPGDVAFWQGALRDPAEEYFDSIRQAVIDGAVTIDVLYRDREGGQRTVSRFTLIRREEEGDDEGCDWWVSLGMHHELDRG
jgi:hypothetical protein